MNAFRYTLPDIIIYFCVPNRLTLYVPFWSIDILLEIANYGYLIPY